ncbi:MAG: HIT domain-containing protein [Minisyncoccia bacterium]
MDIRCAFCEIPAIRKREICRNELAWAFLTNIPIVPGHTLVAPIRCVATFEELTPEERIAIFDLQSKIHDALRIAFGAEGFNYAWNEGKLAGQSVPHFHLHVLPRKEGDTGITEYEPRRFLYRPGSRNESPESELHSVSRLLRDALQTKPFIGT